LKTLGNDKVIIWAAYQRDVELISIALKKEFGPDSFVTYYGKTPHDQRADNLIKFRSNATCNYLVGTAATGGKGITLVESNKTIYYSNTYSLEDRLQSEDRNHRIGQTKSVTYIDFVTPDTLDIKILDNLKSKKDLASEVLDQIPELLGI
jgi:SNF2 family DNA or RNA helicase